MIRKAFFAATLVSIGVFAGARTSAAQDITWNTITALALGSSCSSTAGDTGFIANGDDLSVLFSAFAVSMQPHDSTGVSAIRNCKVAVAATLPRGFYVGKLEQTITYGVVKSSNTSGKITAIDTFFGHPVADFTVDIPFGTMNDPAVTQTKTTTITTVSACNGTELDGLYTSDIAMGVTRSTVAENLTLGTQGLDVRYDITVPGFMCP
jgi:hypothetical protein